MLNSCVYAYNVQSLNVQLPDYDLLFANIDCKVCVVKITV